MSARVERIEIAAYTVPTDGPDGEEADGTLTWKSTTMIVVHAHAGGATGLGYTYAEPAAAQLIESKLAPVVLGKDPLARGAIWLDQMRQLRNVGRPGLAAMALSAVDVAIWDLAARMLGVPLSRLTGAFHDHVPIYGSGGFCNYSLDRLAKQVGGWVEQGIPRVKIKTSRHPEEDPARLAACRKAIGDTPELMTDANGALTRKDALHWAHRFRDEWNVGWFEEPVSSDDREGLRLLRDQGPPGLDIAAGEYGFVETDFLALLQAGAVDCLQADVTRCGGISGVLQAGGLASAHGIELSAHCAPAISAHAFCGVQHLRHLEYFHDHVRIEDMLFDGTLRPDGGALRPDPSRPGLGLTLRSKDAERFLVSRAEKRATR